MTRTAVITLAHGRHAHLANQLWGLARQETRPDVLVAVAIDDPGVAQVVGEHTAYGWEVRVPAVPVEPEGLPLARARNEGARAAIDAGADVLVFLDVDCIPSPGLVRRYAEVLARGATGPVVAGGEVSYLPPVGDPEEYRGADLAGMARPHPARPTVAETEVRVAEDLRLFWSLSFAVTARDWERIGGFDEDYVGYGGEDTDFGQRLGAAGGELWWVGGAGAFHQHHATQSPPVQHLAAIVRNANVFAEKWGWFPMEGWLEGFAESGLAELEPGGRRWRVNAPENGQRRNLMPR